MYGTFRTKKILSVKLAVGKFLNQCSESYHTARIAVELKSYTIVSNGTYHNIIVMNITSETCFSVGKYKQCPLFTRSIEHLDLQFSTKEQTLVKRIRREGRFPLTCNARTAHSHRLGLTTYVG